MGAVTWDKVPNLPPNLRAFGNGFNRRFPNRDGETDGAWGNRAHQGSPSGHNPDDTAGSRPESEDADNKAELRAIDVDADLGESGVTMQGVADAIIADADVQRRMQYVIFNRRIAGKHNGWKWAPYSGDNPHDKHLHGSGDPDEDENGAPFGVIENYGRGGGDELSERASKLIEAMGEPSGTRGLSVVPKKNSPFQKIEAIFDMMGEVKGLLSEIKTLAARPAARTADAGASASDEAFRSNVVNARTIEQGLAAATTKQIEAELAKRDDRS